MKTYAVFLLAAISVVSGKFEFTEEWELWKKEHERVYSSDEEENQRHVIWETNKKYVDNHNKHAEEHGFTLETNKFADLESTEFAQIYNGYRQSLNTRDVKSGGLFTSTTSLKDLPATMDWRAKGYVTEVKNQGQCGSCWAFSTTGSLEGQHFNATGKLVSLSEQNLIDCSGSEGNHGCGGGLMDLAFKYIIKNDGIDKEEFYRYRAHNELCRYWKLFKGATMTSYRDIPTKSEADLQAAVASIGPISVAIDASKLSFQLYKSGVYYEPKCSETKLDHGVLAVGYGTQADKDYWLVKNSWGTSWGMKGYIMMTRNKENNCGIATQASYPIV